MYQNEFNPVTLIMKLKLPDFAYLKRWADITGYIIEKYAQELAMEKEVYIGHIKAIFISDETDYIRLSVYKKDIPVNSEYAGEGEYQEIELIINSIVHGADIETSIRTLEKICQECKKQFLIDYDIKHEIHDSHGQHKDHDHNHL